MRRAAAWDRSDGAVARIAGSGPVLVLAPHPDDESLGCGLLLAELWRRGGRAHVACLTDGSASHPGSRDWPAARLSALRRAELSEAVRTLGGDPARDVTWMGFPDAALHRVHGPGADPARVIAALVDELRVGTVIAASHRDPHCDHVAGAQAALRVRALRPGLKVMFYSIWSRWLRQASGAADGHAGVTVDVPRLHGAKRAAVESHRSQRGLVVRDDPDGFRMPEGFAEFFAHAPEQYHPAGL